MLDCTRETLNLFIENANLLESTRFVNYLRKGNPLSFTFSQEKDCPPILEIVGPDEEDRNSALTIIRKFVSREPISIRKIASLCNDPGISEKWKNRINSIRKKTNDFLDTRFMVIEDQNLELTRRQLFDTFINGQIFHVKDTKKRKKYLEWRSEPFLFSLLYTEMNSILDFLCQTIIVISTITKEELANNH